MLNLGWVRVRVLPFLAWADFLSFAGLGVPRFEWRTISLSFVVAGSYGDADLYLCLQEV